MQVFLKANLEGKFRNVIQVHIQLLTFGMIVWPFLTDYNDTFEISCVCLQSNFLFKETKLVLLTIYIDTPH